MNSIIEYTSWTDFLKWTEKYGWVKLWFRLNNDKTAKAMFVMPSGKLVTVDIADDRNNIMSVVGIQVNA